MLRGARDFRKMKKGVLEEEELSVGVKGRRIRERHGMEDTFPDFGNNAEGSNRVCGREVTKNVKSEGQRLRSSVVPGDWAQGLSHMVQILPGRQQSALGLWTAIPFRARDLI